MSRKQDYLVEIVYKGKMQTVITASHEDEIQEQIERGTYSVRDRGIESIDHIAKIEPLEAKYIVKWIEEKESFFYADSVSTAEWKAFCADDQELTSKKFKVISTEKVED